MIRREVGYDGACPSAAMPVDRAAGRRTCYPHRCSFALVTRLSDARPRSISPFAEGSKISRQAITKHLRVLEEAGLVRAEMVGRECLYEFKPKALDAAQDYLALVSRQWEQALTRLKAFVEKED